MAAKKKKPDDAVPIYNFKGSKSEQLHQIYDQWYGCTRCYLHQFRKTESGEDIKDIVFGEGNPEAQIMIVGEGPGEEEEATSIPFHGPAGRLLDQILARVSDDVGIQELHKWYKGIRHSKDNQAHFHEKLREWRHKEFFITNVVACRPPENRVPTPAEISACWERLYNTIYVVDPWLIIASGKTALEALTRKKNEITKKRGEIFETDLPGRVAPFYKVSVLATLHPSYLMRNADWNSKSGSYAKTVQDFMNGMRYVDHERHKHLGIPIPYRVPLNES
jgi:uracil-DNA glycosylase